MLLFPVVFPATVSALPAWVDSYGTVSPYQPPVYLTGFGSARPDEERPLDTAKQRALSDLAMRLNTRVQSTLSTRTEDNGRTGTSTFSGRIRVDSDVQLENAAFEIEEHRGTYYALSFVRIADLQESTNRRTRLLIGELESHLAEARASLETGRLEAAGTEMARAEACVVEIQSAREYWEVLQAARSARTGWEFDDRVTRLSRETRRVLDQIEAFQPSTIDAALRHVEEQLKSANVSVVGVEPPAFEERMILNAGAVSNGGITIEMQKMLLKESFYIGMDGLNQVSKKSNYFIPGVSLRSRVLFNSYLSGGLS